MSVIKVDYGNVGGGGIEDIEYVSAISGSSSPTVIPTSKKAKAVVGRYIYGSTTYDICCVDGFDNNAVYRNGSAYSGWTGTFNDNNVTLTSIGGSTTYYFYILY